MVNGCCRALCWGNLYEGSGDKRAEASFALCPVAYYVKDAGSMWPRARNKQPFSVTFLCHSFDREKVTPQMNFY